MSGEVGMVKDSVPAMSPDGPVRVDATNVGEILAKYDTLLLDVDGVVWGPDSLTKIPGTAEALQKLKDHNKQLLFVTNNCTMSRSTLAAKFDKLVGFQPLEREIISVNWASAIYLKNIAKIQGKCYVLGGEEIGEELDLMDVKHCGIGHDPEQIGFLSPELKNIDLDPEVKAVLVGMDKHITFAKISKVLSYLDNPDCLYLAANDNEIAARVGRRILPLTGTFISAISTGSKRQPTIIGKPNTYFMACIQTAYPQTNLRRTLMIGDSITGDMAFARNTGIDCMLVLSGVSKESDIGKLEGSKCQLCPDYVVSSVAEMGSWIP